MIKSIGIFFDRDGTLIEDKHYLKNPDEVILLPGVKQGIAILQSIGCKLFLFTNQSGISRGLMTLNDVVACNERMCYKLGYKYPLPFDDICIAPELPTEKRVYRKPSPKFITEMIVKYHLDRSNCYMVGDKNIDVLAGQNAGINSVLISGKMSGEVISDKVFSSVSEFVKNVFARFSSGHLA